ncbi:MULTISPECIES: hypothetical protein [Rathayibacter]|uniref:Uncharacterized protein n=1 Tax=Rathayibacter rubneri TaxID=2950106 RepID=A0A9X2DUD5_9MICO|nr:MULTISPECIES: hypothetical protein [Rathayibacter]MCM6761387.1 hypothetical protein [Rathayibacter rubneri]OOB91180.1 hypothetical protein B0T42_07210 [Rathayibacter sp. VKM Ac-2630]
MDVVLETILRSPATPTGLALMFAAVLGIAFIRGQVVPRSTVDLLLGVERTRAEDYKAAWESEREKNAILLDSVQQLLVYAKTADRVLTALPEAHKSNGEGAT